MFAAGAWFFASTVGHVQDRIDIWLDPFPRYDDAGYQIANGLFAQADGGLFGRGLGAAILNVPDGGRLIPAPETDMIYAVIVNDLGLVGGCRAAGDLPADRRARLQDRDAGQRLVLEAARHRADRRDGAAGVRDRRRRHARDPADRRDAAVRVLRRLLDRGQLHPARAAAGDLQPGASNRHEHVDLPPLRAVRRAVRRPRRVQLALGRVRRHRPAREPEEQPRGDRGAADQARRDPGRRQRGARGQHAALGQALRAPLSDRRAVRAAGRLRLRAVRPRRARAASTTTA